MMRTILITGQHGKRFFTVPYQQFIRLVCMYNCSSLQILFGSHVDPSSSTAISTFVAGVPLIMLQFQITRTVALLPVTLYTVGFIIGPSICSPFSELYGRRMIYRVNFPLLVIFNAIAAASNNFPVLVIFRFLAGVGGSGVLAVGAGITRTVIRDVLGSQPDRYNFRLMGLKRCRPSRTILHSSPISWSNPWASHWRLYYHTAQ